MQQLTGQQEWKQTVNFYVNKRGTCQLKRKQTVSQSTKEETHSEASQQKQKQTASQRKGKQTVSQLTQVDCQQKCRQKIQSLESSERKELFRACLYTCKKGK